MSAPPFRFSWVEKPMLSALAQPSSAEDFQWLQDAGVQVLLSLTEDRPRKDWTDEAGLLVFHEPLEDMEAPTQEQLERAVSAIERAVANKMPVAVHCGAGLGRTGVVLAAYFVTKGMSAEMAISKIRKLRPGSVETDEQEDAVAKFERLRRAGPSKEATSS